jgi:predicted nucleic acid-binding Zn ribbon protein
MGYRDSYPDDKDDDEDLDERDDPDESDMDEDDQPEMVPCPYCRRGIPEDAERCPHCGSYISGEDAPRRKPAWMVVAAVVLIVAIVLVWVVWG